MTNITPETLLKAARIAEPNTEWKTDGLGMPFKYGNVPWGPGGCYEGTGHIYFDPLANDSDQHALWYALADRFIVIFKGHYGLKTAYFWGWRNEETDHENDGYPSLIEALIAAVEAVQL